MPRLLAIYLFLAVQLSRKDQVLKTDWSLNPAVSEACVQTIGASPQVDLPPACFIRGRNPSGFVRAIGFSEQVFRRIAFPQRKSSALLYVNKWKLFRE